LLIIPFLGMSQMTDEQLKDFVKTATKKELVDKNTKLLMDVALYQSVVVIDRLLEMEPDNANFHYRKGYALLHMSTNHSLSLPFLTRAMQSTSKNYDMFNYKEVNAPYDSYFYLARCHHLSEQLDEAIEYYQKYLSLNIKNSELNPLCELFIKHCKNAKEEMKFPKKYELVNLGDKINTLDPEYAPVISLDGQSLYFTTRRLRKDGSNADIREPRTNMHLEDVYVSYKEDDGSWSNPEIMDFCLPERNEATVAVSADERSIFIYKDDRGNGDIFYSEFQDGRFKNLRPIDVPGINSDSWEPHIAISADGNERYFSSDRPGGFGGRDIYRVKKLPNGEWSLPMNLGPKINGPNDEDSPFIAIDNKTLYFSSNGEKSIGGFDIFISVMDEDGVWSNPINLGYPLNSVGDDIYFNTTADGSMGYLSSFRANGFGDKDIYEVNTSAFGKQNISMLKGEIVVAHKEPLPEDISVTIECLDCGQDNIRTVYPRLRDGTYISSLPKCHQYALIYKRGDKEFHRDQIATNCLDEYEEINHRVLLRLDDMSIIPFMKYYLKGDISDYQSKEAIEGAKVEFLKDNGDVVETHITKADGLFNSKLLENSFFGDQISYKVRVSKEDYLTQKFDFNVKLGKDDVVVVHYAIDKPEVGVDIAQVLELNPIYFDLDKSDIRPDAEIELNKIVEIMNDNPKIKIELGSHTDCRGSASYNMALSDRRAKASAAYIKARIDNPNRISGKGYGESKLVNDCACEDKVVSNCSEEEHQENRRTEFRIVQ
jgi:outer membrane protein OmpA-like peptidoglycan-associated protein/tetratricopeptide (TPR) repeat protein